MCSVFQIFGWGVGGSGLRAWSLGRAEAGTLPGVEVGVQGLGRVFSFCSGRGFWGLGFGFWVLGFGVCVFLYVFFFSVLCLELWVLDFGFWISGLGFRV